MGFKESEDTASLLTCLVCREGFGLTSLFCGECGAHRNVALGIERQTIVAPTQRSAIPPSALPSPAAGNAPTPQTFVPELSDKEPNLIMKLSDRLIKHSRLVTGASVVATLLSFYVIAQTIAYVNSSPNDQVEGYIKAVATHDTQYFSSPTLTPKLSTIPFLPSQFNQWPAGSENGWVRTVSWSGWSTSASSLLTPANSGTSTTLDLVAASQPAFLGVINKLSWSVKGPMATIEVRYPASKNLPIFINGIAAGTTYNPAVPAGTYYAFPGPFTFQIGSNDQNPSKYYFEIESSGNTVLPH